MLVEVDWTHLNERDPRWQDRRCLYAYVSRRGDILYIGKAGRQTVAQRRTGSHKDKIFRFCERKLGIREFGLLHGCLSLEDARRLSPELLTDVESLLIIRLRPPCNIASTRSRYLRPGLRVRCTGQWPHRRTGFRDV